MLGASLVLLIVVVMLTSAELAAIRRSYPVLSRSMSWLESVWPGGPDLEHVLLFAGLGFLWRLLMPRVHWWIIASALVVLALTTEAMQIFTIGRTPRWSDARDDAVGATLGLLLAMLFMALLRLGRRRDPA